ncbi:MULTISPECIES: AMP-binding protein [unclassified Dietzia]|uniref:AMP-binding protein n=1 Tax=unclassified Dietzia TaxID=2617939 RepID=UPI000D21FFEA|nr:MULTISPECIES: AMP-binding protein [unclassified Dietzia]AVZ40322.1 acyl-CoA synthetase [Dietzia sp. JS16-p6b]QGW25801.1 fatty-acid--CoA ligase [Dietzia sp. DQ12-45-1b]
MPSTVQARPWRPPLGPEGFQWEIPDRFNIGAACTDAHARQSPAIVVDRGDDPPEVTTFGELGDRARRLITFLRDRGVGEGDRVAVMCAQSAETAVAHVAAYLMGAIAVPLSVKFGPEAALFRMGDSGAVAAVFDADCYARLAGELAELPELATVLVAGEMGPAAEAGALTALPLSVTDSADLAVVVADTGPDDPALLIYTSGTTGQPKGALHGHRVVLGHMPGVVRALDGFPEQGDVFWTPADWAWAGGLLDVLLPSLYSGVPVVASARRPSPETVEHILRRHGVTCSFLPPTILKMMRASEVDYSTTGLRAVFSGGEALGEAVAEWAREALGVQVNEIYGQTECNLIVGTCHSEFATPPGSMGRPTPGFDLVLIDEAGQPVAAGEVGEICVRLPSPNAFLRYWNAPDKTAEKTAGGVLHTGDLARVDERGSFWFSGRNDDLISSSGYRVGPGEIEDQILRHSGVEMVAVIGVPDELRGEAIVAYVVPAEGTSGTDELAREIQALVKERLAFYQYPREVRFLDELPTTNTGKIRRAALRNDHNRPTPEDPS